MRVPFYDKHGDYLFTRDISLSPLPSHYEVPVFPPIGRACAIGDLLEPLYVCIRRFELSRQRIDVMGKPGVLVHYQELSQPESVGKVKPKKKYTFTVRRKEFP